MRFRAANLLNSNHDLAKVGHAPIDREFDYLPYVVVLDRLESFKILGSELPSVQPPVLICTSLIRGAYRSTSRRVSAKITVCRCSRHARALRRSFRRLSSTQKKTRPFSSRCQSSADTRPRRHRANTESWSGFWSRIVALPCPGCLMTILSGRFRVSIAFRRSASTSNKSRRAVVLSRPRCSMLDQLPRAAMWYTRRYRVQRSTTSTFLPPLPAIDETQAPSASDRSLAARRFRAQLPRSAELPQDARNSNRAVGLLKVL